MFAKIKNGARGLLRKGAKSLLGTAMSIGDEVSSIVAETRQEVADKKKLRADAPSKASSQDSSSGDKTSPLKAEQAEPTQVDHYCKMPACTCAIPLDKEYCGQFCQDVLPGAGEPGCGCGHTGCDMTCQIGNEATFGRTDAA